MRAVIQRVSSATVAVEGKTAGKIDNGLFLLLSIADGDTAAEAEMLASKIAHLRIFSDEEGKMNRSLLDISGEALVVSNFTLYGDCRKGRRPYFVRAARPETAEPLYKLFCSLLQSQGVVKVEQGIFGAHMVITQTNDGPVTILLDTDAFRQKE